MCYFPFFHKYFSINKLTHLSSKISNIGYAKNQDIETNEFLKLTVSGIEAQDNHQIHHAKNIFIANIEYLKEAHFLI